MKIVVVGGTGLIGSKTVAILRSGGNEVVAASAKKWSQHRHRGRAQRSDRPAEPLPCRQRRAAVYVKIVQPVVVFVNDDLRIVR
jgi:nucleoside-diphosphate-sugar epimerase